MNTKTAIVGLFFFVFPFLPLRGQVGLGLSPMRLELKMAPGAAYSGPLDLSNEAGATVRVQAELLDFHIDENDTPQFGRQLPEEAANSCRRWLSVNPMEAELSPLGHLLVRYSIRVPAGVPPRSYYCAVGFTTREAASEIGSPMGIRSAVRIVGAFYVVVGSPPIEGRISAIEIEPVPKVDPPAWRAVVRLRNDGDMYFRPEGSLEVQDPQGNTLETIPFQSLPVLPHREQRFLFPMKNAAPGTRCVLRARVDIGQNEVQEAQAELQIEPAR